MKTSSNSTPQHAHVKTNHAGVNEKDNLNEASREAIVRHLSSLQDNDLDALMSGYANDSVLITRFDTFSGHTEIKEFFTHLMKHFPKQKSRFELDRLVVNHNLVYIVWHANTPSLEVSLGSDTYILKDGKIHRQTFVGDLNYISL